MSETNMIELSMMIEGQDGVNWAIWKRLVQDVETLGFPGLFRSDHYTNGRPPEKDSLEMVVSLAYLAGNSTRIHFGPLVSPLSFREPTMLARQAAQLDDLSGGRMLLGLGAGWQEREHTMFGHNLGSMKERMDRFEEGVEVVTKLLNSDEPVTFEGSYFQLREAILLPRPQRKGGPRILIGGSGRQRTLPLVARYADQWNAVAPSIDEFRDMNGYLDDLLHRNGRQPGDLKRSIMTMAIFGRTREDLQARLDKPPFNNPAVEGKSLNEKIDFWRDERHALVGNGEEIAAQVGEWAAAGAQEIMTQWFHLDDTEGLRQYAEDVLPRLS
ncbi:MAG TPA: TIGR03560 family F420-dependent LLM class oxidoreductase [Chloroflexia bacterium]|nr:TIGR03560 family F420-dependent LLM class oxidoreductase [Chloroflexia bacterium]